MVDREEQQRRWDASAVGELNALEVAARPHQTYGGGLHDLDLVPAEYLEECVVPCEPATAGQHGHRPGPVEQRGREADQPLVPAVGDDVAPLGVVPVAGGAVKRRRAVGLAAPLAMGA